MPCAFNKRIFDFAKALAQLLIIDTADVPELQHWRFAI